MTLIPQQIQKTLQIALNRVLSESKCIYLIKRVCRIGRYEVGKESKFTGGERRELSFD